MSAVWDRTIERMAGRERTLPTVPGLNAKRCTGEMSTGAQRLSGKGKHKPFEATSATRFGAKPCAGNVSELWTGVTVPGADDGTEMMREWRESQRALPLPAAKTRKQDDLALTIELLRQGASVPQVVREEAKALISLIISTDPEHGRAWLAAAEDANL